MPDRPDTLQLTINALPECDWQTASKEITCLPGHVVVEMAPAQDKRGVLFLPETLAANLRPDVATVIAVGEGVDVKPGDACLVRAYDGTWRENFSAGSYSTSNQVRCYGVYVAPGCGGRPQYSPWFESLIATIDSDMRIHPTRNNILVRRNEVLSEDRGILLPEVSQFRSNEGIVIEVGPGRWGDDGEFKHMRVKPGDRVVYHPEGMLEIDMTHVGGDPNLCIMPEESIEAILTANEVVTGLRQRGMIAIAS